MSDFGLPNRFYSAKNRFYSAIEQDQRAVSRALTAASAPAANVLLPSCRCERSGSAELLPIPHYPYHAGHPYPAPAEASQGAARQGNVLIRLVWTGTRQWPPVVGSATKQNFAPKTRARRIPAARFY
jgi:hypothetical protein